MGNANAERAHGEEVWPEGGVEWRGGGREAAGGRRIESKKRRHRGMQLHNAAGPLHQHRPRVIIIARMRARPTGPRPGDAYADPGGRSGPGRLF